MTANWPVLMSVASVSEIGYGSLLFCLSSDHESRPLVSSDGCRLRELKINKLTHEFIQHSDRQRLNVTLVLRRKVSNVSTLEAREVVIHTGAIKIGRL